MEDFISNKVWILNMCPISWFWKYAFDVFWIPLLLGSILVRQKKERMNLNLQLIVKVELKKSYK